MDKQNILFLVLWVCLLAPFVILGLIARCFVKKNQQEDTIASELKLQSWLMWQDRSERQHPNDITGSRRDRQ